MSDAKQRTAEEPDPDGPRGHCPTCGHEFKDEELAACHAGCPMSAGCGLVKCPRCGAEFPKPGPVTRWLERLLRSK